MKCACGCGEEGPDFDKRGRPRRFISGHGSRRPGYTAPRQVIINGKNYCLCGCGSEIPLRNNCGRRLQFRRGHMNRLDSNKRWRDERYNWKGGKFIDSQGYVMFLSKDHPKRTIRGYIHEHVLVMEKHLGRYLRNGEQIHHINEVKTDNRIQNLRLFDNAAEHTRYHQKIKKGIIPLS